MTLVSITGAPTTLKALSALAAQTEIASLTYWIDKVLVAILLMVFGLWAKFYFERSRSKLALKNEMAKERIPVIASTWSSVYRFESDTNRILQAFISGLNEQPQVMENDDDVLKLRDALVAKLEPDFKNLAQQANDIEQLLRDNRFWLGEWLHERYYEYLRLIEEKNAHVLEADFSAVERVDERLLAIRQSIDSYL